MLLKIIWSYIWLLFLGLGILLCGILYGAITIAVPYPDPTEAQLAYRARHNMITDWILLAGLAVFIVGVLFIPYRVLKKRKISQAG